MSSCTGAVMPTASRPGRPASWSGVCTGSAIGGAFFGESMFSRITDASKIALVDLVDRLRRGGYVLLDTQFLTEHLQRFGAVEITRTDYRARLRRALSVRASFPKDAYPSAGGGPGATGAGGGTGASGSGSSGSAHSDHPDIVDRMLKRRE